MTPPEAPKSRIVWSRMMLEIVVPVAAWLAAMIFIGHIAYFSLLLLRWWILKEAS